MSKWIYDVRWLQEGEKDIRIKSFKDIKEANAFSNKLSEDPNAMEIGFEKHAPVHIRITELADLIRLLKESRAKIVGLDPRHVLQAFVYPEWNIIIWWSFEGMLGATMDTVRSWGFDADNVNSSVIELFEAE